MADASATALGGTDKWYDRLSSWLSDRIAAFVAFLFILFAAGAFYGAFIVPRFPQMSMWLLLAPIAMAVIAYYSRGIATLLFLGLLLVFIL